MRNIIDDRVDELKEDIIRSAQKIIRIKSVEDEGEEGKPFGKGVHECLKTSLDIANIMGLKTKNVDGYAGHIEIGEGEELLGILCHLDVVPEGNDWSFPPYGAEIDQGKLYGRGSIDDKGPTVAALYALKVVMDSGIKLNKRVRLILGTNEESGWKGLEYYLKNERTPDIAFSPDGDFPVIHGEKGILTFAIEKELKNVNIDKIKSIEVKGGNAPNMVPDYCQAIIETDYQDFISEKLKDYLEDNQSVKLESKIDKDNITIKSYGVSSHGSLPEQGLNAISQLMLFLGRLDIIEGSIANILDFYDNRIAMEYNGQSMGCKVEDDISGLLTFNVGKIDLSQSRFEMIVNVRYPVTYDYNKLLSMIKNTLDIYDFQYVELSHKAPLYVDKDDPLVKKLMKVYQEYTGDMSEPTTIGGGTYARAINKAVAFGAAFPGQADLAHQKDEYISIDDLILITKIYASAIIELAT